MRKNKKILLASVAAMGALALGVGATSTFAWFTTTTSAVLKNSSGTGDLTSTVTDPAYTVTGVEIPLSVVVDRVDEGADNALEMGTWTKVNTATHLYNASGTAGFYHAYIDDNGTPHYYSVSDKNNSSYANFAVYTITIKAVEQTIDNVYYSANSVAEMLKDEKATITIARTSETSPTVNRAMFYGLGTSAISGSSAKTTAPGVTAETAGQSSAEVQNISISGIWDSTNSVASSTGVVYYFGLYIDGENGTAGSAQSTDTAANVVGNFTVTLSKYTAPANG